jgi:hypothetical protein
MKPKAYILVFDGLADWEAAHALCEINKSERFSVVAVGFSGDPVGTMGGLRILPDIALTDVKAFTTKPSQKYGLKCSSMACIRPTKPPNKVFQPTRNDPKDRRLYSKAARWIAGDAIRELGRSG